MHTGKKIDQVMNRYCALLLSFLGVVNLSTSSFGAEKENNPNVQVIVKDSIVIDEKEEELDEVVVSTRGTRTIKRTPTRIELLSGEEINEKAMMKPGDIRVMLSETTGILTQQTSPISGNALIRIQGLDGRYTQILKDGFPAFPGAASGLGLLQTPPPWTCDKWRSSRVHPQHYMAAVLLQDWSIWFQKFLQRNVNCRLC